MYCRSVKAYNLLVVTRQVCSKEEQEQLNKGDRKAEELRRRLVRQTFADVDKYQKKVSDDKDDDGSGANSFNLSTIADDFKRAVAEKDRLLEYQQNR